MKRRTMIAGLIGLPLQVQTLRAQASPYRVSLLGGGFDGTAWQAGVLVELEKGWKTYWRMPGEAGIPPQFDWSKSKGAASITVLYPVPGRFQDLSGETIGYHDRVVFPVMVTGAGEVELNLELFLAVCKDVCIPASARAALKLSSASHGGEVADWLQRVPTTRALARSATAGLDGGKPVIVMALTQPVDDIFVESESPAYFRVPVFSASGLEARLVVDNVSDISRLKGLNVSLTFAAGESGFEQLIRVE